MRGRLALAALCTLATAATTGCGSSSAPDKGATASADGRTSASRASTATSRPSPSTPQTSLALTPPKVDSSSSALTKYDRGTVDAALDLATHLAYDSVTDETLLGTTSPHSSIADYAAVTRYLTPEGVRYLRGYIADQSTNGRDGRLAAELAFANLPLAKDVGKAAQRTDGTTFSRPFAPRNYRATISPKVTLAPDGAHMVVTGRCSVDIPGTQNGKPVLATFTRTSFKYFVQPIASQTYPVGVSGWESASTAKYTPR